MQNIADIRPTGSTDIHKIHERSRLGLKLAVRGIVCALVLSGLLSLYSSVFAASTRGIKESTAVASHAILTTAMALSANASEVSAISMASQAANSAYGDIAWQAALHAGIDPNLFTRQINQESRFNPNASSPAGAEGIAQFMPATAASMGVDPWDPTSALYGGARLMGQLSQQFGGNYAQALAAYNAGPGAVQYAIKAGGSNWYNYLPAETQNYVTVIMGW